MRAGFLALLPLLLASCAGLEPRATGGAWPLPNPALCQLEGPLTQTLRLERGDKHMDLLAVLEPIPGGIQVAGLTLAGQRVLLIVWDARGLRVEKDPLVPAQVDPEAILRDVVLVYWPLDALQATLKGTGWDLRLGAKANIFLERNGRSWVRVEAREEGDKMGYVVFHLQEGYSVKVMDVDD